MESYSLRQIAIATALVWVLGIVVLVAVIEPSTLRFAIGEIANWLRMPDRAAWPLAGAGRRNLRRRAMNRSCRYGSSGLAG
jgi:hypothetical protein